MLVTRFLLQIAMLTTRPSPKDNIQLRSFEKDGGASLHCRAGPGSWWRQAGQSGHGWCRGWRDWRRHRSRPTCRTCVIQGAAGKCCTWGLHVLERENPDVGNEGSECRKMLCLRTMERLGDMQIYYGRVVEYLGGCDEGLLDATLASLQSDPGLHQLLPYLARHIQHQVRGRFSQIDGVQ